MRTPGSKHHCSIYKCRWKNKTAVRPSSAGDMQEKTAQDTQNDARNRSSMRNGAESKAARETLPKSEAGTQNGAKDEVGTQNGAKSSEIKPRESHANANAGKKIIRG